MTSRNLKISEETYAKLQEMREEEEAVSNTLDRIVDLEKSHSPKKKRKLKLQPEINIETEDFYEFDSSNDTLILDKERLRRRYWKI